MLKLKEIRRRSGITQKEFSEQLGIAQNTLSQYETGKNEPDLQTLIKISNYFNVSIDYLVGCDCKIMPEGKTTFLLSENEKQLVISYRSKTEMQSAVKKLLDLHSDKN